MLCSLIGFCIIRERYISVPYESRMPEVVAWRLISFKWTVWEPHPIPRCHFPNTVSEEIEGTIDSAHVILIGLVCSTYVCSTSNCSERNNSLLITSLQHNHCNTALLLTLALTSEKSLPYPLPCAQGMVFPHPFNAPFACQSGL